MLNSPRKTRIARTVIKPIIMTGGLNEEFSNLELKGGELTTVQNYVEKDGSVNGYTSFQGYERYDGQPSPAGVGVVTDPVTGDVTSDVAREAARTLIGAIPGSGRTRGVHIYENEVYGFRDDATPTNGEMYKESGSGWSLVTSGTMVIGGSVVAINARFGNYNSNNMAMVWVDGVSEIHIYNGSAVTTVGATGSGATTEDAALPAGVYPTHVGEWQGRLFLAYPKGQIFFSVIGDPTDFTAVSGAGSINMADDITGFTITPGGSFLMTMKDRIDYLTDTTDTATGAFTFEKTTFSPYSGAILGTIKRMLGTVYFADDRGVTTLEAATEYGDFVANSLAKKVEGTYQNNKANIVLATTNRQDNQYTLFFNGATRAEGLVFSFKGKRLKGATKVKLDHLMHCIAEGKDDDRDDQVFFGSDDGWVFKMYTGTSFDGGEIEARLSLAYHHYGSPTRWKHFKEAVFEISGDAYTTINYRPEFDYNEPFQPTTVLDSDNVGVIGGVWGDGLWGTFTWGLTNIARVRTKCMGYATNMRMAIITSSKYKSPHSLHNMVIQYTLGATKNN